MRSILLKKGREKSIIRKHPWIFSGAIEKIDGQLIPGETVKIMSFDRQCLGIGAFSPESQIQVRMWSYEKDTQIDPAFFKNKILKAVEKRNDFLHSSETDACRLIFSEADGLPGIIVDKYNDYLICQFLSAGGELWKKTFVNVLSEAFPCKAILERSDSDIRSKEGFGSLKGVLWGEPPQGDILIRENNCLFSVNWEEGHKTGFYLDQRDNRRDLGLLAKDKEVLNCFSYTGGFSVYALKGGARHVINVELSKPALFLSEKNHELNGIEKDRLTHLQGDVFKVLREFRDIERTFDCIVLDPPKFVENKSHLERACRGYKDINWLAFRLLKPGGLLFTFSCSGLLTSDLFQKIISDAAIDAGVEGRIVKHLYQGTDHPVPLQFPEALYLKGLIVKKT